MYFKMKLPWKSILRQIKSKKDSQTTLVFNLSKTYQKEISNRLQFFALQNNIKMRSYISFSSKLHQKIRQNNVDFPSIEIRSIYETSKFRSSKLRRTEYVEKRRFFAYQNCIEESA